MDIKQFCLLLVAALVLAGCSAVGKPRMMATFPSGTPLPPAPVAGFPSRIRRSSSTTPAWRSGFHLPAVPQSGRASWLTRTAATWLVSHSWVQDGQEVLSVAVAVPVYSYDTLHAALLTLGMLESENIWGEWVSYGADGVPN